MSAAKKENAAPPNVNTPAADKQDHYAENEAALAGVMALAYLFSSCVEAFGLVHPGFRWEKQEQLLICSLGIQQARLLIWGDCVGVTSPPASVTDRAVPRHPSAAYPDLKEPTFFNERDPRLEEPETRQKVDDALSAIVDRSSHTSREEMMELYGLRPPKKFTSDHQPTLDVNRLESFRERFELLKEVAESYAHLNTRRNSSIVATPWGIADFDKFAGFVKLSQEKVDFLVDLMGVRERVDRAMRMDIRAMGWHLTAERARIAMDISKLKLIQEACADEYPVYIEATKEALWNIDRERRENAADYNPYAAAQATSANTPTSTPNPRTSGRGSIAAASGVTNGATNGAASTPTHKEAKRHGLFGGLFKRKSASHVEKEGKLTVPGAQPQPPSGPPRSMSDVGQFPSSGEPLVHPSETEEEREPLPGTIRSKSVGDILDAPINTHEEEELRNRLEQMKTSATDATAPDEDQVLYKEHVSPHSEGLGASISVHDQYHGLGRQGTKTQW